MTLNTEVLMEFHIHILQLIHQRDGGRNIQCLVTKVLMKRKLILLIFVLGFVGAQAQKNIDSVNFEQPLHNFLKVGLFSSDMVLDLTVHKEDKLSYKK